jgi:hypothetical protein
MHYLAAVLCMEDCILVVLEAVVLSPGAYSHMWVCVSSFLRQLELFWG